MSRNRRARRRHFNTDQQAAAQPSAPAAEQPVHFDPTNPAHAAAMLLQESPRLVLKPGRGGETSIAESSVIFACLQTVCRAQLKPEG